MVPPNYVQIFFLISTDIKKQQAPYFKQFKNLILGSSISEVSGEVAPLKISEYLSLKYYLKPNSISALA